MIRNSMISVDKTRKILKSPYGYVNFGWVLSTGIVSLSSENSMDLLIGRCWDGIYLYPTSGFSDYELSKKPLRVTGEGWLNQAYLMDWNNDGTDDLLVTDGYYGIFYLFERVQNEESIFFENRGLLRDAETNAPMLIPYSNPNQELDSLSGYFEPFFFGNQSVAVYSPDGSKSKHLIIGDHGGNLWWFEDKSEGIGMCRFTGRNITVDKNELISKRGIEFLEKCGPEFSIPDERICNEDKKPFLLGKGYDRGIEYDGASTRPVIYRNQKNGHLDLLVLAGHKEQKLYYLENRTVSSPKPFFKNIGEVDTCGIYSEGRLAFSHSKISVLERNGSNDLAVTLHDKIAVLRNSGRSNGLPTFEFDHIISGENTAASGNNFTVILQNNILNKRYVLDNPIINHWELKEIFNTGEDTMISSDAIYLRNGKEIFRIDGETDPQGGKNYGFNRTFFWDHDNSGSQNLIIGTDTGLLYLAETTQTSNEKDPFLFKITGPLKDSTGKIIKIHNRCCACGKDLNGDGMEDLVTAGISYQMGIRTDPDPGGGIYYIINKGRDEDGIPVLSAPRPMKIRGYDFDIRLNSHLHLQAIDLDKDGEKEIIISNQGDGFKGLIFKLSKDELALEYTGRYIESVSIEENLIDIDGDGYPELVFGGGEEGLCSYRELGRY